MQIHTLPSGAANNTPLLNEILTKIQTQGRIPSVLGAAPVNAVKAQAKVTFSGTVLDGETITIGSHVYEFTSKYNNQVTGSNLPVNIGAVAAKASGTISFVGAPSANDTVTLGSTVYTFKASAALAGDVVVGSTDMASAVNLANAINLGNGVSGDIPHANVTAVADGVAATGVITLSTAAPAANDWVQIGNTRYTFAAAGDVNAPGEVAIGTGGSALNDSAANLAAAINGDTWNIANAWVTATVTNAVVTVTARTKGSIGNAYGLTKSGTNIAVSGAALGTGGGAVQGKATVVASAKVGGTAGNAIALLKSGTNISVTGATLSGGDLATAAEAETALAAAITANPASVVTAVVGGGDDSVTVTAKAGGIGGNNIAVAETCTNAAWTKADGSALNPSGKLNGGVNGTVGVKGQTTFFGNFLYICAADNTVADSNWKKVDISTAA